VCNNSEKYDIICAKGKIVKVIDCSIEGLKILEPKVFEDARGYFFETYNEKRYKEIGINAAFLQDNEALSSKGVIRGLHWQAAPFTQAKLVRVVRGAVLDIVVDIRKNSPTYGQYEAVELSGKNKRQFFVPRGFAHGYVVLEDDTLFSYKCDNLYTPSAERGMNFLDPALGIKLPDIGGELIFSAKDTASALFSEIEPWEEKYGS
jgi:dTDP-4-dehydrorhamnose 3,5-epimerase